MSDQITASLSSVHDHASALDREFLNIAKALGQADATTARTAMLGVWRALHRLAEAAKPITAACPACQKAGGKRKYEPVNPFSGVWSRPECATCRELSQLIGAAEEVARKTKSPEIK